MDDITQLSFAVDTLFLLLSGALVMWMAAGFAMLEAGLVRSKNTTEILTKNVALFAVACLMYLLFGYGIMYPGSYPHEGELSGYFGGLNLFLPTEQAHGGAAGEHSNYSDHFFQVVFVATAMSIVSGAVAERMKLWAFLIFAVVMTGVIYPVEGYWTWGGGFVSSDLGYSDFAGSGIVHMAGAAAALAGVLVLGPRRGKYGHNGEVRPIPGANLPLATLGTFILWLGWFGFNGGSELQLTGLVTDETGKVVGNHASNVAQVFVSTNIAAAAGTVAALILARILFGKADLTMVLNGALAGLVAITANPVVAPSLAAIVGGIGGILVVLSIVFMDKLRIDDPVGAISVHGVVGFWGVMAVVWTGDATILGQMGGAAVIFGWVFGTSLLVWLLLKFIIGIRVSEEEEYNGVDLSECGMEAYPEFTSAR